MMIPFDAALHRELLAPGPAAVAGQAFLRQSGGGVVTCAGSTVRAIPATPYISEALRLAWLGIPTDVPEERMRENSYVVMCDAQGNFTFNALQPGDWHFITVVSWMVGRNQQGSALTKRVTLHPGRNQVLMSDADRARRR